MCDVLLVSTELDYSLFITVIDNHICQKSEIVTTSFAIFIVFGAKFVVTMEARRARCQCTYMLKSGTAPRI